MPTPAYYESTVDAFVHRVREEVAGYLVTRSEFDVDTTQRDAWLAEISILQEALAGVDGTLFLEFNVPRIGSRIDAVLISAGAIFPIEFKVGAATFSRADVNQVWDYALDLKNFHRGSHDAPIFPILVATEAKKSDSSFATPAGDAVYPPVCANTSALRTLIVAGLAAAQRALRVDPTHWAASPYQPTPTIIEAAQALYSQHSVDAIARHDAGAVNLRVTSHRVEELIDLARNEKRKIVVFVTGVPGAGKTLVGLNVATKKRDESQPSHAVFLSGVSEHPNAATTEHLKSGHGG